MQLQCWGFRIVTWSTITFHNTGLFLVTLSHVTFVAQKRMIFSIPCIKGHRLYKTRYRHTRCNFPNLKNEIHFLQIFMLQHNFMSQFTEVYRGPFPSFKPVKCKWEKNAEMASYFVLPRKPLLAGLLVMRSRRGGGSENHLISSTQEGWFVGVAT